MNYKEPIIVVPGEPNSIFLEIFFKSLKKIKTKNPILLIGSKNLIELQMKELNYKMGIKLFDKENFYKNKLDNKSINLININYTANIAFQKISIRSKKYIFNCFETAFEIIKKYKIRKFINGPVNKKTFLNKSFPGMTEYIATKFKARNNGMLIYNNELSVSPLTTHLPIKSVTKLIKKKLIIKQVKLINEFYLSLRKKKPKIAILGLNPHCETIDKFDEDEKIIKPTIHFLKKKKFNVYGPLPADTVFLKQNRIKYDVILGMYHDQVLSPIKCLYEYDAINITLGLPFIRVSPDHGPNEEMIGKNISNPLSLIKAILFLDSN